MMMMMMVMMRRCNPGSVLERKREGSVEKKLGEGTRPICYIAAISIMMTGSYQGTIYDNRQQDEILCQNFLMGLCRCLRRFSECLVCVRLVFSLDF